MAITSDGHLKHIESIAQEDAAGLIKAHESYGDSWKRRGGIGAYMVMIRKFDRMENTAEKFGYDILKAVKDDPRAEGVLDDIRDARRYLMLIESWLRELGIVEAGNHRDNANGATVLGTSPHIKSCECENCMEVKRAYESRFESYSDLDIDAWSTMPHIKDCECTNCLAVKGGPINVIDHPAGCDCVVCKGIRDVELRKRGETHADVTEAALHEHETKRHKDTPHPAKCTCNSCMADRAKARGCHEQCGCTECVADFYLEQERDEH